MSQPILLREIRELCTYGGERHARRDARRTVLVKYRFAKVGECQTRGRLVSLGR
jgi:hypothetical protein